MIVNILIFSWLLLIVLILSFIVRKYISKGIVYPFQNYGKVDVPYITIDIQGVPLNVIVDSGSGISIITKKALEQLKYESSQRQVSLQALTNDKLSSNVVTLPFKVANREIETDFVVYDAEDFANTEKNSGIVMHGLIGNELLDATNCKIDYKKCTVTMY